MTVRRSALRATLSCALVVGAACGGPQVGSVGAVLGQDRETGALFVREAPPGLAAADAGLVPGDEILMIDGRYVRDLTVKELRTLLRGEVGSPVELTIVRGREVKRVMLLRTAIRERVQPAEERIEE